MDNVDKNDLGSDSTNDLGSYGRLDTSNNHTAFSDTPASFVSLFFVEYGFFVEVYVPFGQADR